MDVHAANEAVRREVYLNDAPPSGEWPKSVVTEREAFLLPQSRYGADPSLSDLGQRAQRSSTDGGVYTRDGLIVPSAIHRGGPYRYVPDRWHGPPERLERLAGRWLFGGVLRIHFGHFVLESLARLWGAEGRDDLAGVVFLAYLPGVRRLGEIPELADRWTDGTQRAGFVDDLLGLLCGGLRVVAVGRPTQVEELVIPSQLIGNIVAGDFAAGHPAFRAFVRRALTRFDPPAEATPRRLYVSRSALPPDCVAFLFEDRFEQALAEEGYEILHPERMSIADQIAAYAAAGEIVAPTGSAIHLAAFAMNGRQRVAVIDRRGGTPDKFVRQLRLFGAREVVSIARGHGAIVRSAGKPGRKSKSPAYVIDLDAVWADLLAAGFVTRPRRFGLLGSDALAAGLEALSARLGTRLVVAPAGRGRRARGGSGGSGAMGATAAAPIDEAERAKRAEVRQRARIAARKAAQARTLPSPTG